MSNLFVTSDLHLGHAKILDPTKESKYRPFSSLEEHDQTIVDNINRTCGRRDTLIVLGDVAFNKTAMSRLGSVKPRLWLVGGNHDEMDVGEYAKYFKKVLGVWARDKIIFSHVPIHSQQLEKRFRANVHGHLHSKKLPDHRYVNVCVENTEMKPVAVESIELALADILGGA